MQVILLERVAKLGQMGEVVDVKPGFARNYLLPQGKALTASEANIKGFENRKAQLEAHNLESRNEAEKLAEQLDGQQFVVIRQASDGGNLYGSVSTRDAAIVATEAGFTIDRKQVLIRQPIKTLGLQEAELQASGKTIQQVAAEEEEAADFEIAELFDDIGGAASDDDDLAETGETARPAQDDEER